MKLKFILLYILLFITAFLIFGFLLFPQKEAARYFSRLLSSPIPLVQVSIGAVKPGIPFKLKFENAKFLIDQTTEIVPDSFAVVMGPAYLLKAQRILKFQSDLHQGLLHGRLGFNRSEPYVCSQIDMNLSGVKISNAGYKTGLADMTIDCEISGNLTYLDMNEDKPVGNGLILIRSFSAEMTGSFFNTLNLPMVDFSDVKIEYTQSGRHVQLTECMARGKVIHVTLKGGIDILSPLPKSKLNLTGTLLPDSPYLAEFANVPGIKSAVKNISKNGIRFKLSGTLENPNIGI